MSARADLGLDAVESENLSGHVEPGDLLAPFRVDQDGLEHARPHDVQAVKFGAAAKQELALSLF